MVKELLTVTGSSHFHLALSAALSEYVYTHTPSADQLRAVKDFIGTLIYLPRAAQPPPAYPVRQLDHSIYDLTPKPKTTETTTKP